MVFWGWVSWDNFVARLRKTTSGIRWCRICSLSKRGVLTVLSVTLDQIRDDCSRSEDLRANFPMQGPSPFGVQHTQASCPKSCMDYDWNTSTASSGARQSDQRVFEWRRRWEGCSAVQVVDPNKGSSLPVQNSDRVEQKALLPLLVVKVTGDENRLPKLNSCLPWQNQGKHWELSLTLMIGLW